MNIDNEHDRQKPGVRNMFRFIGLFWSILILLLIGFEYFHIYKSYYQITEFIARESIARELSLRIDLMSIGSEYKKPGTEDKHPLSIINKTSNAHLIAYYSQPAYPNPDSWERNAMKTIESKNKEISEIVSRGEKKVFKYIEPVVAKENCITCHDKKIFTPGRVIGVISVEMPWDNEAMKIREDFLINIILYFIIWIIGITGIGYTWFRHSRSVKNQHIIEEELRLANIKKEEGNKLKSAFIYNISHELRTPLNGILGFAGLIAKDDLTREDKNECLVHLRTSSSRLINTVTNYMDSAMLVTGVMNNSPKTFNFLPEFHEIEEEYKSQCFFGNIVWITETPVLPSYDITIDQEHFRKILKHLLDNAIKFTSSGSITFGYRLKKDCIEFFVKDTGAGISREAQLRIFDHFVQEETSMTRGFEGSGLGLSIAQGLAKLSGSQIYVSSEKNVGSEFYFCLPSISAMPVAPPQSTRTRLVTEHPVVLVADDEEANLHFMKLALKKTNCRLLLARNGQEAVDICMKNRDINLVFMDIRMPVKDGFESTIEIKKILPDVPVVAVTAYNSCTEEKEALEAGCSDFISKPFALNKIYDLLREFYIIE